MKQQFQKVVNKFHDPLLGLVGGTLGIHPRNRHGILRTDDAHFLYLLVKFLVRYKISRFRISEVGFLLQLIPLGGQLRQVAFLLVYHHLRSLHYGRENGIHRTQYDCREEHDAKAQDKGA